MVVESSAGGTGRHVLDLCQGLVDRGCGLHLVYSPGRVDRTFLDRLTAMPDLPRTPLMMRTCIHPSDAAAVGAVRRCLREFGPFDVVHGHSSKGGAVARLARIGTGVNAFYTLHGFIPMDPGLALWKRLFYLSIEIALGLGTRRIIAVSPEEARAAVRLGLGRARVTLIPNGIAPLDLTARPAARRSIGVADDAFVIGFVGRLVDQKAPDVLIRAFARVVEIVPRAKLAMVGSGPLEPALRRLAAELRIEDHVRWLGERDSAGMLAGFDVFALPSRKEGLPYVVLEAMSAGLPVVATLSAGVEILVRSDCNGQVVPTDDHARLAAALVALADDPHRLTAYGRASREQAAHFTIDAMVDNTIQAYAGVLRERIWA
jgi:glycosyltransferase involved in cell wall biosynthesis